MQFEEMNIFNRKNASMFGGILIILHEHLQFLFLH